jgi:hypothetical protein
MAAEAEQRAVVALVEGLEGALVPGARQRGQARVVEPPETDTAGERSADGVSGHLDGAPGGAHARTGGLIISTTRPLGLRLAG